MSVQNNCPINQIPHFTPEKKVLLKNTFCKGSTDDQLELFIHACTRSGLDPFMRQIYAVFRKDYKSGENVMTIQTGIDGYRLIAERTGKYMPGKEYTFGYDPKTGSLVSATAYVKKLGPDNQWHEIAYTVFWKEYVAQKDGNPIAQWKDKPHVMLGKCAEAAVLRKAFPADMSGFYTSEEMQQADVNETINVSTGELKTPEVLMDAFISIEEAYSIERDMQLLIAPIDPDYKKRALDVLKIDSFEKLPISQVDRVRANMKKKIDEIKKKELQSNTDDSVPF